MRGPADSLDDKTRLCMTVQSMIQASMWLRLAREGETAVKIKKKIVTCCAEEAEVITGHPTSCLGPQTTESAWRTRSSCLQTAAQHWPVAAS